MQCHSVCLAQQIEPQIGCTYGVGLLGDEVTPLLEAFGGTGKGKGDQQAQQAKDRALGSSGAGSQTIRILFKPVQASLSTQLQKQQHGHK